MLISDIEKINNLIYKRDDLRARLANLVDANADVSASISVSFKVANADGVLGNQNVQARVLDSQTVLVVETAREALQTRLVEVETELVELGVTLDV